MSPVHSPSRALSVCLHLHGAPAGRRDLPLKQRVTLGPRPSDTFCVLQMEHSVDVVEVIDGVPHLQLRRVLDGQITGPDGIVSLGDRWPAGGRLPIPDDATLTVEFASGVCLTLALTHATPEAPLVAGRFRPPLWDEDARAFVASLGMWALLAGWLVWIALHTPIDEAVKIAEIPDRLVEVILQTPEQDDPPPEPPKTSPPRARQEDLRVDPNSWSWGRRRLDEYSEVMRQLSGAGDPQFARDEGEILLEVLDGVELYSIEDVVDRTLGGPRTAREHMGDATITLQTGRTGAATVVAVASQAPDVSRWMPEALEPVERRGPPSTVIRDAVRSHQRQLRACYERRLKERPHLNGRIVMELDIEGGRVVWADIAEDTVGDAELGKCMILRARSWRFPKPVAEKLSLPFSFGT
ncbi:MAG: AgmX/PglI C-terminal domain-containing protein [Myxococcota bacterium]